MCTDFPQLAVDMVRDALQWSTESSPVVQQLRKAVNDVAMSSIVSLTLL